MNAGSSQAADVLALTLDTIAAKTVIPANADIRLLRATLTEISRLTGVAVNLAASMTPRN